MPTLTREARALLPLVLSAVLVAGGLYNLVFIVGAALSPVLQDLLPPPLFAVLMALLLLGLAVGLVVMARGAARQAPHDDAWHHLAVVGTWLSLVLAVMAACAVVGAMLSRWPSGATF